MFSENRVPSNCSPIESCCARPRESRQSALCQRRRSRRPCSPALSRWPRLVLCLPPRQPSSHWARARRTAPTQWWGLRTRLVSDRRSQPGCPHCETQTRFEPRGKPRPRAHQRSRNAHFSRETPRVFARTARPLHRDRTPPASSSHHRILSSDEYVVSDHASTAVALVRKEDAGESTSRARRNNDFCSRRCAVAHRQSVRIRIVSHCAQAAHADTAGQNSPLLNTRRIPPLHATRPSLQCVEADAARGLFDAEAPGERAEALRELQ